MDVQAPSANPVASLLSETQQFPSEKIYGKAALAELQSLAREQDSELRRDGLISLAARLEGSGREEAALRVYALLPEDKKAAARKAALEGQGDFGAAFETQLRRLRREVFQPQTILPMMAGSAVYGLSRGALLGRLLANPRTALWTRGLGARWTASAGAFLLEAPVFATSSRAMLALSGERLSSDLSTDIARSALTLGLFKVFGAGGQGMAKSLGLPPSALGSFGLFAGLLTAQGLEEKIGLRPELSRSAALGEALTSMLSLSAGTRLGRSLLGRPYARFLRELELRAERVRPTNSSGPESFFPAFQLAGAKGISGLPGERGSWESTVALSRGGSASAATKKSRKQGLSRLEELIDHELLPEAWRAFPEFKRLKSQFSPREFRIVAAKIGPLFVDPAMNRRAYAFIFLDRLVPGLSPFRRMKQLARIDRGFLDPNPWVRELATQAFDHNAAFWPRQELTQRIPDLKRLSRDPERRVQEAAFRGLVRMTEFLAPERRLKHLRGLARYFAKNGDVGHFKSLPFNRALRSLQPRERLQIVVEFEKTLPEHCEDFHFIPFFGDMISRLEPSDQTGRVQALEQLYFHSDPRVRIYAMTAVDNNMDRLPRQHWPSRILHFEDMLKSHDGRIRERAVTILGGLLSSEPSFINVLRTRKLERRMTDSDPAVREATLTAQQRIALALGILVPNKPD